MSIEQNELELVSLWRTNVKKIMKFMSWTQQDLADMMGVARTTVCSWLKDDGTIPWTVVIVGSLKMLRDKIERSNDDMVVEYKGVPMDITDNARIHCLRLVCDVMNKYYKIES